MKINLITLIIVISVFPTTTHAGKLDAVIKIFKGGGNAVAKEVAKDGAKGKKGEIIANGVRNGLAGKLAADWRNAKDSKKCHSCGGDGKTWFRECTTCKGSGRVKFKWVARD